MFVRIAGDSVVGYFRHAQIELHVKRGAAVFPKNTDVGTAGRFTPYTVAPFDSPATFRSNAVRRQVRRRLREGQTDGPAGAPAP